MIRCSWKKSVCLVLVLVVIAGMLPVLGAMAAKENFLVSSIAITGIDKPIAGATPDYTAAAAANTYSIANVTSGDYKNGISWTEYDADWEWQREMSPTSTFQKGCIYVVTVKVEAADGKYFSGSTTATINGQNAHTNGLVSSGTIYTSFSPCQEEISNVALTVVNPVVGKTPTFAKVDTTSYESKNNDPKLSNQSNGCTWTNTSTNVNLSVSNPFKEGVSYAVTYTLYPKTGCVFASNVTATINGKTAQVENKGTYIMVKLSGLVPSFKTITPITITNVTEPAVGKTPNYTITASGDYFEVKGENNDYWTNGVAWVEFLPGASSGRVMKKTDTFKTGNRYAIYVDVASTETGYGFVKDQTQATVNGKSATVVAEGSTARLIHTFPAVAAVKVSSVSITVTAPAAGAKPVFNKIDGNGFYSDNNGNLPAAFKNGIAWFKTASSYIASGTTETFEAGKSYTLKISLVAKDDYSFASNLTGTVNGKTATVTVINDSSAVLEIVLSTPAAAHTHTSSGWKSDDLNHWKECTDSSCAAIVVQKQLHLNTNADGKCDTCGYQLPVEVPEPTDPKPTEPKPTEPKPTEPKPTEPAEQPTEPAEQPTESVPVEDPTEPADVTEPSEDPTEPQKAPDQQSQNPDNSWIWIVVVIVGVAGLVLVVVLLMKKKK